MIRILERTPSRSGRIHPFAKQPRSTLVSIFIHTSRYGKRNNVCPDTSAPGPGSLGLCLTGREWCEVNSFCCSLFIVHTYQSVWLRWFSSGGDWVIHPTNSVLSYVMCFLFARLDSFFEAKPCPFRHYSERGFWSSPSSE